MSETDLLDRSLIIVRELLQANRISKFPNVFDELKNAKSDKEKQALMKKYFGS